MFITEEEFSSDLEGPEFESDKPWFDEQVIESQGLSNWSKIGIAILGVVILLLMIAIICCVCCCIRKSRESNKITKIEKM